jgi:hypothetical protein
VNSTPVPHRIIEIFSRFGAIFPDLARTPEHAPQTDNRLTFGLATLDRTILLDAVGHVAIFVKHQAALACHLRFHKKKKGVSTDFVD